MDAEGTLRYNPEFVRKWVANGSDLFCLIFHELLHPAFGHFMRPSDPISNVACDAIINAAITQLFAAPSGNGSLFTRFYPERGLPAILRPGSHLKTSRYSQLYEHLYPTMHGCARLSAGEVIQTLRVLEPEKIAHATLLLGSHPSGSGASQAAPRWPDALLRRVAGDLLKAVRSLGQQAGYFGHLQHLLIEVLRSKVTIRQSLLLDYSTRRKLDRFFTQGRQMRRITSPFPLNPSRRDLVLLSAGIWPGLFRNRLPEITCQEKGVAIFLDVSGSVNEYLPRIVGILSAYRHRIQAVYLFSNAVVESSMEALCRGRVTTTYGTDFDCVAREIVAREFERAVVITDGFAALSEDDAVALREKHAQVLTILFGGKLDCLDLAVFGEAVQLTDVVE
jgi:hypothetical protein